MQSRKNEKEWIFRSKKWNIKKATGHQIVDDILEAMPLNLRFRVWGSW